MRLRVDEPRGDAVLANRWAAPEVHLERAGRIRQDLDVFQPEIHRQRNGQGVEPGSQVAGRAGDDDVPEPSGGRVHKPFIIAEGLGRLEANTGLKGLERLEASTGFYV
jgi:hypothetical protein